MVFGRIHCIARGLECPFYFGKKDKQKTGIGCSPIPVSIDPIERGQTFSLTSFFSYNWCHFASLI